MFVCQFVSNKRRNNWTDRVQIFRSTSLDPREGLCKIEIRFSLNLKINEIFYKIRELFLVLFYKVEMFTVKIDDRREAP